MIDYLQLRSIYIYTSLGELTTIHVTYIKKGNTVHYIYIIFNSMYYSCWLLWGKLWWLCQACLSGVLRMLSEIRRDSWCVFSPNLLGMDGLLKLPFWQWVYGYCIPWVALLAPLFNLYSPLSMKKKRMAIEVDLLDLLESLIWLLIWALGTSFGRALILVISWLSSGSGILELICWLRRIQSLLGDIFQRGGSIIQSGGLQFGQDQCYWFFCLIWFWPRSMPLVLLFNLV